MSSKSFYDLDYIIDVSEKRLEQYTSAYQKILERLTNLILIYSAITIFLIQLIQDIFLCKITNVVMWICFILFGILFMVSVFYTIRLIIPEEVAYLEIPKKYYSDYRQQYEQTISDKNQIATLLQASYITELEIALTTNERVFRRKSSFYYNALMFGLLSSIPYLACLGFHISKKEDNIQKVEIVNLKKNSNFSNEKGKDMSKDQTYNNNSNNQTSSSSTTATTTQIPGVNNSQVITSSPNMIKENSQNSSNEKKVLQNSSRR